MSMYQFNGFTEKANHAVNLAIQSAESFGHTYIGSEHILLGLLKNEDGAGYTVLEQCGASAEKLSNLIEEEIGTGEPTRLSPSDFTPRTKRILQNALRQAAGMGHGYVGTEHLLGALLYDSSSYAVRFLEEMGVHMNDVVRRLNDLFGENSMGEAPDDAEPTPSSSPVGKKHGATKTLDQYGRDLTEAARKGEIDPVIGRQEEIDRIIQIPPHQKQPLPDW